MSTPALPLEGVSAIERAGIFAGPWTGTLVGDFGAEVVKVERPEYGDPLRDGLHDEQLGSRRSAGARRASGSTSGATAC